MPLYGRPLFSRCSVITCSQHLTQPNRPPSLAISFHHQNTSPHPLSPICTRTFDNHTHRAGIPSLERSSNHRGPTPLTLASRCVRSGRPGECETTPGPLEEYRGTRGCRPQNDTGFFLETSNTVCIGQMTSCSDELTKLKKRQRRAEKPHNDGLRWEDDKLQRRDPWADR